MLSKPFSPCGYLDKSKHCAYTCMKKSHENLGSKIRNWHVDFHYLTLFVSGWCHPWNGTTWFHQSRIRIRLSHSRSARKKKVWIRRNSKYIFLNSFSLKGTSSNAFYYHHFSHFLHLWIEHQNALFVAKNILLQNINVIFSFQF